MPPPDPRLQRNSVLGSYARTPVHRNRGASLRRTRRKLRHNRAGPWIGRLILQLLSLRSTHCCYLHPSYSAASPKPLARTPCASSKPRNRRMTRELTPSTPAHCSDLRRSWLQGRGPKAASPPLYPRWNRSNSRSRALPRRMATGKTAVGIDLTNSERPELESLHDCQ